MQIPIKLVTLTA